MYNSLNPIEDWYSNDERIKKIIDRLSFSGLTELEQAKVAFEEIADIFDLPKYPENFSEVHYEHYSKMGVDEPRSVFEEATIIRYLEPEDDPRGVIMLALYNVKNGIQMPMYDCALKHFGSKRKIPGEYMVCILGEGIFGRLHFLNKEESWNELNARCAMKIIS